MRNIIQIVTSTFSSKVKTLVVAVVVAVSAVVATADVSEAHWVGTGADDNWTTSDNWSPSGSPANKSIVFGAEDRTVWGQTPNSIVDQDLVVSSICFTNNNFAPAPTTANCDSHVVQIGQGRRLKVTGMDTDGYSLCITSPLGNWDKNSRLQAAFTGGGALEIDSPESKVYLACNSRNNQTTTRLNLSGLSEVTLNISNAYVGCYARMTSYLTLSKEGVNTLTANAILVGDGHGSTDTPGSASELQLGKTNIINADYIGIASSEPGLANVNSAKMLFQDVENPTVSIRAKDGVGRAELRVGGHGQGGAVQRKESSGMIGTLDLSAGTVDALVGEMHVTRACGRRYDGSNNGGSAGGVVKMSAGKFDVNSLFLVYSVYNSKSDNPSCRLATGSLDVSGGRFVVNEDAEAANNRTNACQGVTADISISGGEMSVARNLLLASRHGYATNVIANVDVSSGKFTVYGDLIGGLDDCRYTGTYTAEKINLQANVNALGGVIAVTNAAGTSELRLESGTLALAGGKVYADSLVMTNEASTVSVELSDAGFTTAEVGALKLGGNLSVTLADGFKTHGGMAWHVVEGRSARTGTFETVDLPEGLRVCYTANGFDIATEGGFTIIVR